LFALQTGTEPATNILKNNLRVEKINLGFKLSLVLVCQILGPNSLLEKEDYASCIVQGSTHK
jgi:hypothetical protein